MELSITISLALLNQRKELRYLFCKQILGCSKGGYVQIDVMMLGPELFNMDLVGNIIAKFLVELGQQFILLHPFQIETFVDVSSMIWIFTTITFLVAE